jgi:hypothetical protein
MIYREVDVSDSRHGGPRPRAAAAADRYCYPPSAELLACTFETAPLPPIGLIIVRGLS